MRPTTELIRPWSQQRTRNERPVHSLRFERRLPLPEPTASVPGSPEKIEVLRGRFEAGEELWHDADCRLLPSPDSQRNLRLLLSDRMMTPVSIGFANFVIGSDSM